MSTSDHFEGKSAAEHLKKARLKGAIASAEIHGIEMPGHLAAAADAAKETAFTLLILWIALSPFINPLKALLLFTCGYLLWKTSRSALLGWSRMERLHRLIEEEKWEIEHHRGQEREELTELYRAKGFSGKLLDEVIDVLMADDDRLLRVMLEEELGLTLEAYEHPLKQSMGALLGVLLSAIVLFTAHFLSPSFGIMIIAPVLIAVAAAFAAKLERNSLLYAVVWNLSIAILTAGSVYFIGKTLLDK